MVDFVIVVMGMVVVIEVEVMLGIGMPVTDEVMGNRVRMGTGKELGVHVVRPLRKERSRTPFCMLVR